MKHNLFIRTLFLIVAAASSLLAQAQVSLQDMDEDDWMSMRDTSGLTRKNRTVGKETRYNTIQYIVNDIYKPDNETSSNTFFSDNVYLGVSMGLEGVMKEDYVEGLPTLGTFNIFAGKEFSPLHSVRLSLCGAVGYTGESANTFTRFNVKGDYLYNITNRINGYKTTRGLQVSLLGGIGLGFAQLQGGNRHFSFDAHAGVQFKIYTGPFGSIALEPYVAFCNDSIDFDGGRNWRGFDWAYGINIGYIFATQDDLSRESRARLLQSRLWGDRLIDRQSLESWRTPWFLQYSMGAVTGNGKGSIYNFNIGRWMSPVIGLRASVGSRMTAISSNASATVSDASATVPDASATVPDASPSVTYGSHLFYGKLEALFNPFGFRKNFSWEAPIGAYLFWGLQAGQLKNYAPITTTSDASVSSTSMTTTGYSFGFNLWCRLSKDLHFFIEPNMTSDYYTVNDGNGTYRNCHDNTFGLNVGLSMLIRSPRYRDPEELDEIQDFIYRDYHRFFFGIAAGGTSLQRTGANYGHPGFNYSLSAYGGYTFCKLHGINILLDFMHLSANTLSDGALSNMMLVTSINYQLNITNLCSGRFHHRSFQLEAFAGPAVATTLQGETYSSKVFGGLDIGLKLSCHIARGINAVLTPTLYMLNNAVTPTANTVAIGNLNMFHNITVGFQFDTSIFKRGLF